MDWKLGRTRKKVRLGWGGVIIFMDLRNRPRSSSPGHRKLIRKLDSTRFEHRVYFDEIVHKIIVVGVQAEVQVSSAMRYVVIENSPENSV